MIEKRRGGNGLYDAHVGYSKFMGLFTALDRHIIPDEYLSAMSNLHRTRYGFLESVRKPETVTTGLSAPLLPIYSIQRPHILYIGMGGSLYNDQGVQKIAGAGVGGFHVVEYIAGMPYTVTWNDGLVNASTGAVVAAAIAGYADAGDADSNSIAIAGSRCWFTFGTNKIRGSDIGDLEAADNGEGWSAWGGPNSDIMTDCTMDGYITGIFDTGENLLIFQPCKVFKMSPFNFESGTQKVLVYAGPDLPLLNPDTTAMFPYTDGASVFYAAGDGFFMFDSKPVRLSSALDLPIMGAFYVGQYDDRVWFLARPWNDHDVGDDQCSFYAVDLQTGVWEQYDMEMGDTLPDGITYDTPTALFGGMTDSAVGENELLVGTSCGYVYRFRKSQTGTDVLPWSFTTKAFAPNSYDQPIQPVQVMIDYVEQATSSPVTITVKYDEVTETDTITLNMQNAASQNHIHRGFDCPHTRSAGSVTITVSGTGPCTILDIGLSFLARDIGDSNP